jgi:hypothetical protein
MRLKDKINKILSKKKVKKQNYFKRSSQPLQTMTRYTVFHLLHAIEIKEKYLN